jgi:SH3-like domain-containing protein
VFKRKAMPVEIVAEYENWRKIRDWQGASGWGPPEPADRQALVHHQR